uniref:RALY heterogeneous nuclear ribonucleoprotein n=1 Tax=Cyclopterus lumpus TaxID=8103 RepID=A0A8C2YXD4_CYCLU
RKTGPKLYKSIDNVSNTLSSSSDLSSSLPSSLLFEYHGRASPVPRVVPVKRQRVEVPLVRRVKSSPVKLLARNASAFPTSNGNKQRLKGAELQGIKSELTQIKANIEGLLGRLDAVKQQQQQQQTVMIAVFTQR